MSQKGATDTLKFSIDEQYDGFITKHYSSWAYLVVIIASVRYILTVLRRSSSATGHALISAAIAWSLIVAVLVGMVIIWLCKGGPKRRFVRALQAFCPIASAVALSMEFLRELLSGTCRDPSMPQLLLAGLRAFPFFIFFMLRDTSFIAIIISWLICLTILTFHAYHTNSAERMTELVSFTLAAGAVFFDSFRQNRSVRSLIADFRDILTENEELAVQAQALELRSMIGNVAHDLKTPLTSLLSGIECMGEVVEAWGESLQENVDRAAFADKAREGLAVLRNCLKNMRGCNSFMTMTINRCIDYTKASKGVKLVPRPETAAVLASIEMPVDLMRTVQSAISIAVQPVDVTICSHIITDKQWLLENLLCLLSNAVKYSHKGTVEVGVRLQQGDGSGGDGRGDSPQQYLRFEVQDTGVGLSEEAMQTLFNPFKQAQRLAGGTGLGLFSLAKRVEALHGQYGVRKRPDGAQGSLFWFTIPYRPDEVSAKMQALSLRGRLPSPSSDAAEIKQVTTPTNITPKISPREDGSPPTALVVDDAPLIVKMTTMLLRRKGHSVESAVNGAAALEKLLQGYEQLKDVAQTSAEVNVVPAADTAASVDGTHSDGCSATSSGGDGGDHAALPAVTPPFVPPRIVIPARSPTASASTSAAGIAPSAGQSTPYDVVLMDLQMPVLDGIETIRRLRAAEQALQKEQDKSEPFLSPSARTGSIEFEGIQTAAPPSSVQQRPFHQLVIALSANSDEETRRSALEAGADAFMPKPFTYETFVDILHDLKRKS